MQRIGDAFKSPVAAGVAFFRCDIPQGHYLSGWFIVRIIEKGAVQNDVQQIPFLGKPFGFKPVDPFFSIEAADALFGLFFLVRGDKMDVLILQLVQRPAKNPLKGWV